MGVTSPWRGRSGEEPPGALQADGEAGEQREQAGKEARALRAGGEHGVGRPSMHLCRRTCIRAAQVGEEGSGLSRGCGLHTEPSPEQGTLELTKHWSFHGRCLSLSFPGSENTRASRRGGRVRLEGAVPTARGRSHLVKGCHVNVLQWHLIVGGTWGWGQLVAIPPSW